MKQYLAALLISTIASVATAQQSGLPDVEVMELDHRIFCSETGAKFIDSITMQYGETPLFTGNGISTIVAMDRQAQLEISGMLAVTVNQVTGSFGVFMIYPDGSACELASGTEFEPYVEK